jgi:hypothetical protein
MFWYAITGRRRISHFKRHDLSFFALTITCHSEEANPEFFYLVYNNRPTKNLTFQKARSVFFLHSRTKQIFSVETADSSVAVVSINMLGNPMMGVASFQDKSKR